MEVLVFGKRVDKPGGGRKSVREEVMVPAAMMTMTDTVSVDLLDLSRSGAKFQGKGLPSPGQEVLLLLGRLEAFAKVVWRDGDSCGVRFDVPLSDRAVSVVEAERGPCSLAGIKGRDALAASDWLNGLAR